jgi:SAM-dependent methyltransferase
MIYSNLISPNSKKKIFYNSELNIFETKDSFEKFEIQNGVVKFLNNPDTFYEGAYLATTNYVPKFDFSPFNFPLFFLNSGYIWRVKSMFKNKDTILELGCGGGIKYFSNKYKMIGLDLSFRSLINAPYSIKIQANANSLPIADETIDGIISNSFWEHIDPVQKSIMLDEFKRVLKKNGKIVFCYDVETENILIKKMKVDNPELYSKVFLLKDGHLGYQTPYENELLFREKGFDVIKHFGIERSIFLAPSALLKLKENNYLSKFGSFFTKLLYRNKIIEISYMIFLNLFDRTFGLFLSSRKSRVILTTLIKK